MKIAFKMLKKRKNLDDRLKILKNIINILTDEKSMYLFVKKLIIVFF